MFKKIKRLLKLSKLDDKLVSTITAEKLDKEIDTFLGNGKAEFFGDPTIEETLAHKRNEDGTLSWYERLKNL